MKKHRHCPFNELSTVSRWHSEKGFQFSDYFIVKLISCVKKYILKRDLKSFSLEAQQRSRKAFLNLPDVSTSQRIRWFPWKSHRWYSMRKVLWFRTHWMVNHCTISPTIESTRWPSSWFNCWRDRTVVNHSMCSKSQNLSHWVSSVRLPWESPYPLRSRHIWQIQKSFTRTLLSF